MDFQFFFPLSQFSKHECPFPSDPKLLFLDLPFGDVVKGVILNFCYSSEIHGNIGSTNVPRVTLNYVEYNQINLFPWPSRSPDVSPIETGTRWVTGSEFSSHYAD